MIAVFVYYSLLGSTHSSHNHTIQSEHTETQQQRWWWWGGPQWWQRLCVHSFAATGSLHVNRHTWPFVPYHTSSSSYSNNTQNSSNNTNNDTNDSTKRQACKDEQTTELTSQLANILDYGPRDCWCPSKLACYVPTISIWLGDELVGTLHVHVWYMPMSYIHVCTSSSACPLPM